MAHSFELQAPFSLVSSEKANKQTGLIEKPFFISKKGFFDNYFRWAVDCGLLAVDLILRIPFPVR